MADKPAETAAPAPRPPKSKKMLVIILAVVLVLALATGGAYFYVLKQRAAAVAAELGDEKPTVKHESAAPPPVYFPFESMVVNLADPGGEKVVQIGITLELADSHATDLVKQYLPTIRSAVLILVSQRTSEELLQRQGKEKLATDIQREALRPLGVTMPAPADDGETAHADAGKAKPAKKTAARPELPIRRVLFSSFIVQ